MQRVFVVDKNKKPLMPCSHGRAKELLKKRKAVVLRLYPFTILIKEREGGDVQPIELKIDPGSKISGIALVADFKRGKTVIWAANIEHKGNIIRSSLQSRRSLRRGRRHRKTRYRAARCYEKEHWIDAACVGETGEAVHIAETFQPLFIIAKGRGSRQFCRMDKHGFPRTQAKKQRTVHGFRTGDLVKAIVPEGKKQGTYSGRVAIRSSGYFCIDTLDTKVDGISHKHCQTIQYDDGYVYISKTSNTRSSVSSSP